MRFLFTTNPLTGHLHPLIPIAQAALAVGHEVAVACSPSFTPAIEQVGFSAFAAGFDWAGRSFFVLFPGVLRQPEFDRGPWTVARALAGPLAAMMVPDLVRIAQQWHPDIIVRETAEFGGALAAEVLGIPHASVRSDSDSSAYSERRRLAPFLSPTRELLGLPPDPDVASPFRYLHLACEPPGFLRAGEVAAPTAHLMQPSGFDRAGLEQAPTWLVELRDRPIVYATLGTLFSRGPNGRAIIAATIAALRDEGCNLVVTVGPHVDPADFGPQPAWVRIERYIPQSVLLPYCDAVVHHGGYSTVTGALSAGRPSVVIPIGADHPYNADCCVALGVGKVLGPEERTAGAIRSAVREVRQERRYRDNAQHVQATMAALPGPEYGVALLEQLARERRPLTVR